MKHRIIIILALSTLIVLDLLLKIVFKVDYDGLMINLLTELIGGLITFLLIDNVINYYDNKNKQKLSKIALSTLKKPIKLYFMMWFHIFDSDEDEVKKRLENIELNDFILSDEFLEKVKNRDFSELYNSKLFRGTQDSSRLNERVIKILADFKALINSAIDKYAIYFDSDTITLLQHFGENANLYDTFTFWEFAYKSSQHNFWLQSLEKEYIKSHLTEFLKLVDLYNNSVDKDFIFNNKTVMSFKKFDDKTIKW